MPDATISALNAAAALDGTEAVPIAQATSTVRTTTQDIANLLLSAVNVVSTALSALSDAHTSLVNRVSVNSGGAASVTSNDLSAAVKVSAVSAATSVQGLQSVVNQLSNRTSVLSHAVSVVSQAASAAEAHASTASAAATSADGHANTASAAATSVDARVNTVSNIVSQHTVSITAISNQLSGVSCRAFSTSGSATTSVKGLQSVLNRISNTFSNAFSAGSVLSGNVTSLQSTVSHLASIVSNVSAQSAGGSATGLQNVINMLSNKISQAGGASVTSAEYLSTSSIVISLASAVSLVSCTSAGGGSATGLQAVVNALSNKISTVVAGTQSVTSLEYLSTTSIVTSIASVVSLVSANSVGVAKAGLQSAINALSNTISAVSQRLSTYGQSCQIRTRGNVVSSFNTTALSDIVSMSCTLNAGGQYRIEGAICYEVGQAGGVAFGVSIPDLAAGGSYINMWGATSVSQDGDCFTSGTRDRNWGNVMFGATSTLQTAIVSLSVATSAVVRTVNWDAFLNVSAAGSFQLMTKMSATGQTVSVRSGYIKALRVG